MGGVKRALEIRIGTSGWTYTHWRGLFYPSGLPQRRWLVHYAAHLDTVEVNATFYRSLKPDTFRKWAETTPEGFLFALKAPRSVTHVRRLRDIRELLEGFYQRASLLGSKLGPILFQLPPSLPYDGSLAQDFLAALDPGRLHAVEVRHDSWLCDAFFQKLEEYRLAFCISDTAGRYPFCEVLTAPFAYVRLHGSRVLYRSAYTKEELRGWAERIRTWRRPTFLYFDNDFEGNAARNAIELKAMFTPSGPSTRDSIREGPGLGS